MTREGGDLSCLRFEMFDISIMIRTAGNGDEPGAMARKSRCVYYNVESLSSYLSKKTQRLHIKISGYPTPACIFMVASFRITDIVHQFNCIRYGQHFTGEDVCLKSKIRLLL